MLLLHSGGPEFVSHLDPNLLNFLFNAITFNLFVPSAIFVCHPWLMTPTTMPDFRLSFALNAFALKMLGKLLVRTCRKPKESRRYRLMSGVGIEFLRRKRFDGQRKMAAVQSVHQSIKHSENSYRAR